MKLLQQLLNGITSTIFVMEEDNCPFKDLKENTTLHHYKDQLVNAV
jgi:hypothetical protein